MSQPLIDLQHISKSFDGEMVLDDLNLSIKENSFVTLLGPSGCSSLLCVSRHGFVEASLQGLRSVQG